MNGEARASRVTGRRQAIALRVITAAAALAAALAVLAPDPVAVWAGLAAVAAVVLTPLLRVAWLVFRWWQERDYRFVVLGLALLGIVAVGAVLALAGG